VPVRELVFHLYPNAFESTDTVFAREGGTSLRGLEGTRPGGIDLELLAARPGGDLLSGADDELVPGDRTQLRVPLASPVEPGGELAVRAVFAVRLPSLVARMGQAGDFVMAAQWFPKLATLMPDGTFRSTPYHGAGEFDADFADYDLTVEVPPSYVVAAPGTRAEPTEKSGNRERYLLPRARDIAWAAAPDFQRSVRAGERFVVETFAPPGSSRLAARQAELASRVLVELSELLGPYPHERLVIVIPPASALGAAGMEYPGLIVGWTASAWARLFPAASLHDVVTAHELAHQWFPMLVASNEVDNPVLDEGLAEWLGLHVLRDRYGDAVKRSLFGLSAAQLSGIPLDAFDLTAVALTAERDVPSSWSPVHEVPIDQLASAMYFRPAVVLEALAEQRGRARLLRTLGAYARENRYRHVTPADFTRALDTEYGAGFSNTVIVPALAGRQTEIVRRSPSAYEVATARALPARLLSWVQLALSWVAL